MSALSELQQHLARYWALPSHENAELKAKLDEVQAWQRARIQQTHKDVFEQKKTSQWRTTFSLNCMVVMSLSY